MRHFKILFLTCVGWLVCSFCFSMEYHVGKNGNDGNAGTELKPFITIAAAVRYAVAGDTITVHTGTYREWVNPLRGGSSNLQRIVYRAAPGEKVELKGSEVIKGWKKERNGVWKVILPNTFFGDYNPYKDSINGDWFLNKGRLHHTGEVFLKGKSLYEMEFFDKLINPVEASNTFDSIGATYTWYCESDEQFTTIWANFQQADPNKQLVEITTRPTVFYPSEPGINFITISGFHISQAATQWAAPTAEQTGMIATHWNKGWIIENNVISDSKCNGITLGKDRTTGQNVWSADKGNVNRDGNIHYIEVIFNVLRKGWSKETIGSHIVRNNQIYNCEQTGICGSMGAAFSTIENNHIYNIWQKRQFEGWEIGGIKFHAPIDVIIRKNNIHNSGRGIWLDWMTQGARVSQNLFYSNDQQDLFIEVNHGPYLVDNNILLSPIAISNQSEGGAYVHNLIAGEVSVNSDLSRFTPYFLPHSTSIAGLTTIFGGDDRFYNNIFIGDGKTSTNQYGLESYNIAKLPVWISGNVYYNEASPSSRDEDLIKVKSFNPNLQLLTVGASTTLHLLLENGFYKHHVKMINTAMLGKAKISKSLYENPDGSAMQIDVDYFGKKRDTLNNHAGPFAALPVGEIVIKIWK